MKILKFNENFKHELTPEMKDFSEWCLNKSNVTSGRYFYNKTSQTWYDDMAFKRVSWEEIFQVYLDEKYDTKKYNV